MPIKCEIVSQDREVFQGDVDIVVMPGVEGEMGILPNHTPLLTVLQYGIITIRIKQEETHFAVSGGIAEVQPDQVTILADAVENVDEIDEQRAEEARKRAEEALKQGVQMDYDSYTLLRNSLNRSNLRLNAVRRFRQSKNMRSGSWSEKG